MDISLRVSDPEKEGFFHASKWIKHQFLISEKQMEDLLKILEGCLICHSGSAVPKDQIWITQQQVRDDYVRYIATIQEQEDTDMAQFRKAFCNYITADPNALYGMNLSAGRVLVKVARPVIQMQLHHFFVSKLDGKFHSMVMSKDSIHFGIQLSYPQIFEHPFTHEFFKVTESEEFPNTKYFKGVLRWLRQNTLPTPLIFQGKKTWAPFRTGKGCFQWAQRHPLLKQFNLEIASQTAEIQ
ncbi:MAG: hypothetical protein EBZ47_02555 [Chlamydiae bacterium]|nr:hypothetical protein [Chlamydiota bacterium]